MNLSTINRSDFSVSKRAMSDDAQKANQLKSSQIDGGLFVSGSEQSKENIDDQSMKARMLAAEQVYQADFCMFLIAHVNEILVSRQAVGVTQATNVGQRLGMEVLYPSSADRLTLDYHNQLLSNLKQILVDFKQLDSMAADESKSISGPTNPRGVSLLVLAINQLTMLLLRKIMFFEVSLTESGTIDQYLEGLPEEIKLMISKEMSTVIDRSVTKNIHFSLDEFSHLRCYLSSCKPSVFPEQPTGFPWLFPGYAVRYEWHKLGWLHLRLMMSSKWCLHECGQQGNAVSLMNGFTAFMDTLSKELSFIHSSRQKLWWWLSRHTEKMLDEWHEELLMTMGELAANISQYIQCCRDCEDEVQNLSTVFIQLNKVSCSEQYHHLESDVINQLRRQVLSAILRNFSKTRHLAPWHIIRLRQELKLINDGHSAWDKALILSDEFQDMQVMLDLNSRDESAGQSSHLLPRVSDHKHNVVSQQGMMRLDGRRQSILDAKSEPRHVRIQEFGLKLSDDAKMKFGHDGCVESGLSGRFSPPRSTFSVDQINYFIQTALTGCASMEDNKRLQTALSNMTLSSQEAPASGMISSTVDRHLRQSSWSLSGQLLCDYLMEKSYGRYYLLGCLQEIFIGGGLNCYKMMVSLHQYIKLNKSQFQQNIYCLLQNHQATMTAIVDEIMKLEIYHYPEPCMIMLGEYLLWGKGQAQHKTRCKKVLALLAWQQQFVDFRLYQPALWTDAMAQKVLSRFIFKGVSYGVFADDDKLSGQYLVAIQGGVAWGLADMLKKQHQQRTYYNIERAFDVMISCQLKCLPEWAQARVRSEYAGIIKSSAILPALLLGVTNRLALLLEQSCYEIVKPLFTFEVIFLIRHQLFLPPGNRLQEQLQRLANHYQGTEQEKFYLDLLSLFDKNQPWLLPQSILDHFVTMKAAQDVVVEMPQLMPPLLEQGMFAQDRHVVIHKAILARGKKAFSEYLKCKVAAKQCVLELKALIAISPYLNKELRLQADQLLVDIRHYCQIGSVSISGVENDSRMNVFIHKMSPLLMEQCELNEQEEKINYEIIAK